MLQRVVPPAAVVSDQDAVAHHLRRGGGGPQLARAMIADAQRVANSKARSDEMLEKKKALAYDYDDDSSDSDFA